MNLPGIEQLIGDVLQDTYRIERVVGKGGMGAVFEASHLRLARRFAIKMLVPDLAEMPEALARFRREAEITSAIGHPNILEVIDFNHDHRGAPYIVMELLEGEPLSHRLKRKGALTVEETAVIFRQLASALQAAHGQGVVHRDLKPQNIFLCQRADTDTFVKVFDFGISKVLGSQSALTRSHSALGTPYYMSPEQAEEDAAHVDLRTDIFATGTILYELLAGRPPFTGEATLAVLFKIVNKPHKPIRALCPELPEALEGVIDRALAKQRDGRFSSMGEFWSAFATAVGCEDTELRQPDGEGKVTLTLHGIETASTFDASGPRGRLLVPGVDPGTDPRDDVVARPKSTTLSASVGELGTEALSRRLGRRRLVLPAAAALLVVAAGGAAAFWATRGDPVAPVEPQQELALLPAAPDAAPAMATKPAPAPDAAPAVVLRKVTVRPRDARAVCRGRVGDGPVQERAPPCAFEVPTGSRFSLWVGREGYVPYEKEWTVSADEQVQVGALQLKRAGRRRPPRREPRDEPPPPVDQQKPAVVKKVAQPPAKKKPPEKKQAPRHIGKDIMPF